MALTWVESDLVNGDFETGDLTGWTKISTSQVGLNTWVNQSPLVDGPEDVTVNAGETASFFADAIDTGAYFAYNLGGSSYTEYTQSITLPADAKLIELSAIFFNTASYTNYDRSQVALELYNGTGGYIGGAYICLDYDHNDPRRYRAYAVMPADAVSAIVRMVMGPGWNSGVGASKTDEVRVRWATGADEITASDDLMVNGGFESGNASGWDKNSGSGSITTDAAYRKYGSYALRGIEDGSFNYSQTFDIDPSATHAEITAWPTTDDWNANDTVYIVLAFLDIGGLTISSTELTGPQAALSSTSAPPRQVHNSLIAPIPEGAAKVVASIINRTQGYRDNDCGIDEVAFRFLFVPKIDEPPGLDSLTYQWSKEGVGILPGEVSKTLGFIAQPPDDGTLYYCDVTGTTGAAESRHALLTVLSAGPLELVGPVDVAVYAGDTATFSVVVTGGVQPYTYSWTEVGLGPIQNFTDSLSFVTVADDDGRKFYVVVVDAETSEAVSRTATLTILERPQPPEPPEKEWPDPEVWPPDYECAISMPCCLPAPLVAGHGYESSSRVRRNDLASGPPIYTLEDDDGYELFNVSWSLNNIEAQIFRNFYRHTIASGSKEFCIDLMVDGWNGTKRTKTHRVYFEGQPQYSLHGLRWNVSATLLAIQEQINDECDGLLLAEAYCVFTSGLEWAMADLHDIVENVLWEYP